MDDAIDGDAPLDYASIQIFPSQNRYEAFVYREKHSEKVAAGLLEHLLSHVPGAKGLNSNFDLKLPENMHGAEWFSKATVERFLHVVSSPELTNATNAIMDEMSQLEESKKFHLSLYGKGNQDHPESGEGDGCSSPGAAPTSKPEVNIASSDASKNELLRAMDLRLTALSKELAATFNKGVGATCSLKDMTDLAKFSQHFGATTIEHSLCKFIELNQKSRDIDHLKNETTLFRCDVMNGNANPTVENPGISKPEHSVTPVMYGVSPAKVAQVERQSSTESEDASHSSDEGQRTAERSRSLIRSASPRRSASPMWRVQIGRAGPRRATALTIKSLNFFPARERSMFYRDSVANGCEGEVPEPPYKKPEIDVRRITVKDAIDLFESKQRDQAADVQKRKSLTDNSITANKSVLRRWSAGMGETSVQEGQPEIFPEDPVPASSNDGAYVEIPKTSEAQGISDFVSESHNNNETTESDLNPEKQEDIRSYTVNDQAEANQNLGEEQVKKLAASAEWNQQKQAEFNQILMKMMESKPVKYGKSQPSRNQNISVEQRGGSYNHYKEKRDAKIRGEKAGKPVEKEPQFRAMQQTLDQRKAEMESKNLSVSNKGPTRKPQTSPKNSTLPINSPKEPSKPSVTKKIPSKTSTMATIRKSWSSTPSPRAAGTSPAKIRGGVSSASSTRTHRKPLPTSSIPQPGAQREKSQERNRNENETLTHNVRSVKSTNEKRPLTVTNKSKAMKAKVTRVSGEISAPSKISECNKGTKKSSVMPLESKPFLSEDSGVGRGAGNFNKKKNAPPLEQSLRDSGHLIEVQESVMVVKASDVVSQQSDQDIVTPDHPNAVTEPESQSNSYLKCGETENVNRAPTEGDDVLTYIEESSLKLKTEEDSTISPMAWVEIEEDLELPKPCDDNTFQIASVANIAQVGLASPRVRQSLSQMLREESGEANTSEWGNAENPPAMIYQKDAPKGLKGLLKFARKSKGDTNSTGWSSPSVYSEGEDDAEESKSSKKNADKLLRKGALQAKSYGQPKSSLHDGFEINLGVSNLGKLDGKGSNRMQEGLDSGAGSNTKASRSFFSLSAFRGSKP